MGHHISVSGDKLEFNALVAYRLAKQGYWVTTVADRTQAAAWIPTARAAGYRFRTAEGTEQGRNR
jgi:hypothetical protein